MEETFAPQSFWWYVLKKGQDVLFTPSVFWAGYLKRSCFTTAWGVSPKPGTVVAGFSSLENEHKPSVRFQSGDFNHSFSLLITWDWSRKCPIQRKKKTEIISGQFLCIREATPFQKLNQIGKLPCNQLLLNWHLSKKAIGLELPPFSLKCLPVTHWLTYVEHRSFFPIKYIYLAAYKFMFLGGKFCLKPHWMPGNTWPNLALLPQLQENKDSLPSVVKIFE